MKKVLYNGKVYVERDHFAQAVLIEDEKILLVGSNEQVLAEAGGCQIIDCRGKTVIPGLNDSHLHLVSTGQRMAQANITGCTSIDQIVDRCRQFIDEYPEAARHGVVSTGWNQDLFTTGEKRYLYRQDLDRISTQVPVVLSRICGHILAANTKAIELAGIGPDTPQFPDGTFEFGEDGFPNGFFSEFACGPVKAVVPPPTEAQIKELTLRAMDYCVSHGLTSVQSKDIGNGARRDGIIFRMMRSIRDEGRLPLRYHHQLNFRTVEEFCAYLEGGEPKNPAYRDSWLTLGPLKLYQDGSLGARTATVRSEYLDDPGNFGVEAMSQENGRAFVSLAAQNGMQVVTHAIGDKAIIDTLDHYEKVLVDGKNPLRHSVVHYQCVDRDIIRRTVEMGILAHCQPIFLTTDIHAVGSRFSPQMNRWFLAFKSYLANGVNMSFGSDSPVEDCNPFLGIYCAVTRKDVSGKPQEGFFPEECIDVADAIDCYTVGSAYAQFQEGIKGRIKAGMLADLVVLDADIFTCPADAIKDILPTLTMVGGKIVYSR